MLASDFPAVHVVANEQNRGYAAAVNQFIKICRGAVLLVLNADIAALDGAIDKTLNFLHHHEEPALLAAGCSILTAPCSVPAAVFPTGSIFYPRIFISMRCFPKSRCSARSL
jgi:GT2 family glycosyltransferase